MIKIDPTPKAVDALMMRHSDNSEITGHLEDIQMLITAPEKNAEEIERKWGIVLKLIGWRE